MSLLLLLTLMAIYFIPLALISANTISYYCVQKRRRKGIEWDDLGFVTFLSFIPFFNICLLVLVENSVSYKYLKAFNIFMKCRDCNMLFRKHQLDIDELINGDKYNIFACPYCKKSSCTTSDIESKTNILLAPKVGIVRTWLLLIKGSNKPIKELRIDKKLKKLKEKQRIHDINDRQLSVYAEHLAEYEEVYQKDYERIQREYNEKAN